MVHLHSIILAGGAGTRLWPLSRTYFPKQFYKIRENSLFQDTIHRALLFTPNPGAITVVTNRVHHYLVTDQIQEIGLSEGAVTVLDEPEARNTLPAVAYAMGMMKKLYPDSVAAIFPSDHFLEDSAIEEIRKAVPLAGRYLVTFGVLPDSPNTGFGYIAPGEAVGEGGFRVHTFREKPDPETAARYVREGYLWNSGIFLFSAEVFSTELAKHAPAISQAFESGDVPYREIPSISIDYGLMERSDRIAVVPLHARWNDLGTFSALREWLPSDKEGNTGNALFLDSENNFVSSSVRKTALIGVRDLAVVETGDALLVCNTACSERVRDLVDIFRAEHDPVADFHLTVYRPWGSYTELELSRFFRIKRVTVKPGHRLSHQMHHHRSEHWVVVSGMADVQVDSRLMKLARGMSTYVPEGTPHRLGNSGKIPLEVIEVQIGEYLEEDDIVRFEDDYHRDVPEDDTGRG